MPLPLRGICLRGHLRFIISDNACEGNWKHFPLIGSLQSSVTGPVADTSKLCVIRTETGVCIELEQKSSEWDSSN